MLLRHLIALMIDVRPSARDGEPIRPFTPKERTIRKTCLRLSPKTFACLTHPAVRDQRSDHQRSDDHKSQDLAGSPDLSGPPNASPLHNVKHPPAGPQEPPANPSKTSIGPRPPITWWSQTGSNRRPHACKARALPTELWPPEVRGQRSEVKATFF
jgi:hypothetical protein